METFYGYVHSHVLASSPAKGKTVLGLALPGFSKAAAWRANGITYRPCSFRDPAGQGAFDIVHLGEGGYDVDGKDILSAAKKLLKDDGKLIISLKNIPYDDRAYAYLERHLKRKFAHVRFFCQRTCTASRIWAVPDTGGPSGEFPTGHGDAAPDLYFVIASDAAIGDVPPRSDLVDTSGSLAGMLLKNSGDAWTRVSGLTKDLEQATRDNLLLKRELQGIKDSVAWKLVAAYQAGVVERLFRRGTARRRIYDRGLSVSRLLVNRGLVGLWRKYRGLKRIQAGPPPAADKFSLREWKGEPLEFPEAGEAPEVSIIIPVHNNATYTYNCLRSVAENTGGPYEVVLLDNGSADWTPELLKKARNVKVIKNEDNPGFLLSCNAGAAASRGKYLLFLNNDTIVQKGWLAPLLDTIRVPGVGAVGSRLIFPDGKLQEAGGIVWSDASAANYGRDDDPERPEYNFVREVDYCSGASLLVRKDLFERIGGFDERFKPGYYEDVDLCFSLRELGFKVMYDPGSTVVHFEGRTGGTDLRAGAKKYQEVNRYKLLGKWGAVLKARHREPGSDRYLARHHGGRKNILVIDVHVPMPGRDAGSLRMYYIVKMLRELGHHVTVLGDMANRFEPYTSMFQRMGVEVVYEPYVPSVKQYLADHGAAFDLVVLSRPHVSVKYVDDVKTYCRKAKVIYDTVDLQFLRFRREAELNDDWDMAGEAMASRAAELRLAGMSDVTLTVSDADRNTLLGENPALNVEVISLIQEAGDGGPPFSGRKDIVFLGFYLHKPNVDAALWLAREVFPLIKAQAPEAKLYLVGGQPTPDMQALASDDVVVAGHVPDLAPIFNRCRVFLAPLRYGAGVKGKITESMGRGVPVVTTTVGAEGMGLVDGVNAMIADDARGLAEKALRLYRDEGLWGLISSNALGLVRERYDYGAVRDRMERLLYKLWE